MIGITRFARFAGLAALPAILPAFAKAAWLSVLPEFNPFKYNSFPVNGARQSYRLTHNLQGQVARYERAGQLSQLPPITTATNGDEVVERTIEPGFAPTVARSSH
jgi:alpha-beta hydrolase superfamily lysophospholipase